MTQKVSTAYRGALLVAGTAIGAGMLALPLATAGGGFFPSLLIFFLCWIFTAGTGLLLLEVCLWMPAGANIISMAEKFLGPLGKAAAWILYLFLFYCLTIAYSAAGGNFCYELLGHTVPHWSAILIFVVLFSVFVWLGTKAVDRMNILLMAGLGISYFAFLLLGVKKVDPPKLFVQNWFPAFLALPVMFTSFSYQGLIPSLTTYLQRNPRLMRIAILVGSSIPFFIYVVWQYLILGIVPVEHLEQAALAGKTAVDPLRLILNRNILYAAGQAFAFFALTTSFLGVTLGLTDFLADGLRLKKIGAQKLLLWVLVFTPPMLIAMFYPTIFLIALRYAGGVGCALLLGLLPILMVWVGRYKMGLPGRQFPGGKKVLSLYIAFVIFELVMESLG